MIMEDYEIDYETACPKCGHDKIHYRSCTNFSCNDGYIDLYDEDPLWYRKGETKKCPECKGTGVEIWCPNCGAHLSGIKLNNEIKDELWN